jgi:hypothetical protein
MLSEIYRGPDRCLDNSVRRSQFNYRFSIPAVNSTTNTHPRNVVTTGLGFCASRAVASGRAAKSDRSGRAGKASQREGRTGTKTSGGRAAKSTRSRVSRSDRGKEDETHNFQRIHACLPYTPLEATSYLDRQEP